jgi:hypothetical protein
MMLINPYRHKRFISYGLLAYSLTLCGGEETISSHKKQCTASSKSLITTALQKAEWATSAAIAQEIDRKITESMYCPNTYCWLMALTCKQHAQPNLRLRLLPLPILAKISQFLGPAPQLLHTFAKRESQLWVAFTKGMYPKLQIAKVDQGYMLTSEYEDNVPGKKITNQCPTIMVSGDD